MSKIMRQMYADAIESRAPRGKRYSSNAGDPGYDNWVKAGSAVDVLLDGERVSHCIVADEAEGYVECYLQPLAVDAFGNLPTEIRRGKVEVQI
jgi:hypothetical protein